MKNYHLNYNIGKYGRIKQDIEESPSWGFEVGRFVAIAILFSALVIGILAL